MPQNSWSVKCTPGGCTGVTGLISKSNPILHKLPMLDKRRFKIL